MVTSYPDVSNVGKNFMEIQVDGRFARIYFLPGIPANVGSVPVEPEADLEGILRDEFTGHQDRVRSIMKKYSGRTLDVAGVLIYALEQNRFEEFAQRLEDEHQKRFNHIPKVLQYARTDMMRFFKELYLDLGHAQIGDVKIWREIDSKGPGLIVLPDE